MLLSTLSQLEPMLNHALLQCLGFVFITSLAPAGVNLANLALQKLKKGTFDAFAHFQKGF
jgi:hypothetical protein